MSARKLWDSVPMHGGWAAVGAASLCAVLAQPSISLAQAAPAPAASASPASSPAVAAPGGGSEAAIARLVIRQRDALGRSCELQQVAGDGPLRFLACGAAGLWIARLTGNEAALVEMRDLGGRVGPFFRANNRLWVEVSSVRAQEVSAGTHELTPLTASAPTLTPAADGVTPEPVRPTIKQATPTEATGRIVTRSDETLVVELSGPRVKPGTHIALVGRTDLDDDEQQVFAVGRVVKSTTGGARVAIGTNEDVPDSAQAQVSSAALSGGIFAPARASGVWELGFLARPFVVLEDLGTGAVLDAYVGYRFRAPFHVEASLTPLALATARAGALASAGGFVSAAYDSHLFSVGLGLGVQTVNVPDFTLEPGSGLLLAQRLRLGARDGAHLAFLSYVTLFHSNFQFSSLRVEGQIPLASRTWLRLAGGGGSVGLGFGEVGLRVLMSGNGGAGSFFLTTAIGWTQLFRECNDVPNVTGQPAANGCRSIDYNGPMLGAGGELRL